MPLPSFHETPAGRERLAGGDWIQHPQHAVTFAWLADKEVVVCPLAELGFVRISTHKKVFNFSMDKTRELLATFITERKAARIADDLPALNSKPEKSEQVTDHYLADLAAKHDLRFATLDTGIKHAAVELVS